MTLSKEISYTPRLCTCDTTQSVELAYADDASLNRLQVRELNVIGNKRVSKRQAEQQSVSRRCRIAVQRCFDAIAVP